MCVREPPSTQRRGCCGGWEKVHVQRPLSRCMESMDVNIIKCERKRLAMLNTEIGGDSHRVGGGGQR